MKSYDEEDDTEDPLPEALAGAVQGSGGTDELGNALLLLSGELLKLGVLLSEMDEEDFKAVKKRYQAFRAVVEMLPAAPVPRRRMGFQLKKGKRK